VEQIRDKLGITYSVKTESSLEAFNNIIESYLGNLDDVMPKLDALLEVDSTMPMALVLKGYMMKLGGDPKFTRPIKHVLSHLLENNIQNEREALHIAALHAWTDNHNDKALDILETLLISDQKDMLALRIAHYMHFYAGTANKMRDSVNRAIQVWREDDPFYAYLLGMYSFGLEESGHYEEAEKLGKKAILLNPRDVWASHAVTHVFQMQKRSDEGIAWLEDLIPQWRNTNNFAYHLQWHKALFYLGKSEYEMALSLYDQHLISPLTDDFYLDVCNATSLLWRLEMLGVDVGDRWQTLAGYAENRVCDDELVFSSLHYLMVPARLKNTPLLIDAMTHYQSWSKEQTNQGGICKLVGLPLAESIIQFGAGDYTKAKQNLNLIQDNIVKIGGSHAQRHLFDDFKNYAEAQSK